MYQKGGIHPNQLMAVNRRRVAAGKMSYPIFKNMMMNTAGRQIGSGSTDYSRNLKMRGALVLDKARYLKGRATGKQKGGLGPLALVGLGTMIPTFMQGLFGGGQRGRGMTTPQQKGGFIPQMGIAISRSLAKPSYERKQKGGFLAGALALNIMRGINDKRQKGGLAGKNTLRLLESYERNRRSQKGGLGTMALLGLGSMLPTFMQGLFGGGQRGAGMSVVQTGGKKKKKDKEKKGNSAAKYLAAVAAGGLMTGLAQAAISKAIGNSKQKGGMAVSQIGGKRMKSSKAAKYLAAMAAGGLMTGLAQTAITKSIEAKHQKGSGKRGPVSPARRRELIKLLEKARAAKEMKRFQRGGTTVGSYPAQLKNQIRNANYLATLLKAKSRQRGGKKAARQSSYLPSQTVVYPSTPTPSVVHLPQEPELEDGDDSNVFKDKVHEVGANFLERAADSLMNRLFGKRQSGGSKMKRVPKPVLPLIAQFANQTGTVY